MVQLPRTMHNTGNPRRWDTAALARRGSRGRRARVRRSRATVFAPRRR